MRRSQCVWETYPRTPTKKHVRAETYEDALKGACQLAQYGQALHGWVFSMLRLFQLSLCETQ